jgi:hypothetical protein
LDELEGKDLSNKACIENKHGDQLGLLSICPWPASPSPYIKVARSQGTGRVRYILQYVYTTWTHTLTMNILGPSLTDLRGTQVMRSISYTLVSSPQDSTRIVWVESQIIISLTSSSPCTQLNNFHYIISQGVFD